MLLTQCPTRILWAGTSPLVLLQFLFLLRGRSHCSASSSSTFQHPPACPGWAVLWTAGPSCGGRGASEVRCEPGQGSTLTRHLTSLIFNEKSTTFRLTSIYPVPLIQYLCILLNTTVPSGDYFTRRQAQTAEWPLRRTTWGETRARVCPGPCPSRLQVGCPAHASLLTVADGDSSCLRYRG